jgi:hypothetical protein
MAMSSLLLGHLHCQPPSLGRLDPQTGADFATVYRPWPEMDALIAALNAVGPGWPAELAVAP